MEWGTYMVVAFTGAGSETVNLNNAGFDGHFAIGTTQYGYTHIDSKALTIWKNADGTYKTYGGGQRYSGSQDLIFSPDFTGLSVGTVTMQIEAYAYTSPAYAMANSGNWGSYKVELAEQTVALHV
jgi:hypothetical protein